LETFNADELLEKLCIYLDHRVQEEKRPETPNKSHVNPLYTVSSTNDFAAKVSKRTRKIIGSKPGDIFKMSMLLV